MFDIFQIIRNHHTAQVYLKRKNQGIIYGRAIPMLFQYLEMVDLKLILLFIEGKYIEL